MTTITLDIDNNDLDEPHPTQQDMSKWLLSFIQKHCHQESVVLSITFITEDSMRQLNKSYRQKDKSTNVLSFPAQLPAGLPELFLGDIVFCHAVIEREAKAQGKSLEAHYAHMLIHGTLHLLGFDHIETKAAKKMEKLEVNVMTSLGYPDPYREDA